MLSFNYTITGNTSSPETLDVALTLIEPSGVKFAPHPVYFDVQSTGGNYNRGDFTEFAKSDTVTAAPDNTMRHSSVYVNTGDTGQRMNDRVYDGCHRDKSRADGVFAYHVYDRPDTYTVSARQIDLDGNHGTSTETTFTVVDPVAYFTAAQTIVVAPDGDFAGAPHEATLPASNRVSTIDAARTRFRTALAAQGNVRIVLKRGFTYSGMLNSIRADDCTGDTLLIDAWGTGANPVYDMSNDEYSGDRAFVRLTGNNALSLRINNVDVTGNWLSDASTPSTPAGVNYDALPFLTDNNGTQRLRWMVWSGCTFSKFQSTWVHTNGGNSRCADNERCHQIFNDCHWEHCGDYMGLAVANSGGEALALLGCKQTPHPNQESGSLGRNSMAPENYSNNSHASFRGLWDLLYATGNNLATDHGWSGDIGGGNRVAGQQVWRMAWRQRQRVIHTKNFYESGAMSVFGFRASGEDSGHLINALFEKNYCVMTPGHINDAVILTGPVPNTTIRNNIFLRPNTPAVSSTAFPTRNFDRFQVTKSHNGGSNPFAVIIIAPPYYTGAAADPAAPAGDIHVVNNILIDLKTAANGARDDSQFVLRANPTAGSQHALVETDNVIYAPGLSTPINAGIALDNTSLGFNTTLGGLRWVWEYAAGTFSSEVAPGEDIVIPYPNDWYGNPLTAADFASSYGRETMRLETTFRMILTSNGTPMPGQILTASNGSQALIEYAINNGDGTWTLTLDAHMGGNQASETFSTPTVTGATVVSSSTYNKVTTDGEGVKITPWAINDVDVVIAENIAYSEMTVAYEAGGIRLTNSGNLQWRAGSYQLRLDRGTGLMDEDPITRIPDGSYADYKLSAAIAPSGSILVLDDIKDNPRPGHVDHSSGANSQGPWVI